MTIGLWRDDEHRYFVNAVVDGDYQITAGPLLNVTGAIKAVNKADVLVGWAKRETAACAVRHLDELKAMVAAGGPDSAINWLKTIPDYQRDTAASLGSRVHAFAEAIAAGHEIEVEPDAQPYVAEYLRFREEWRPTDWAVEQMVVNLTHGYAGTLDLLTALPSPIEDGADLWLIDIKTSQKEAYKENALQLAGLNGAEYMGWPDREDLAPMPRATRFGILLLRPPYRLVEMNLDPDTFEAFLEAKRLQEWLTGAARFVVGTPVKKEKAA